MNRSDAIQALRERLAAFEPTARGASVQTAVGTLASGAVHEWCGGVMAGVRSDVWLPPLCVLAGIAGATRAGLVVWVGERCWPHASLLARGEGRSESATLLGRSIFVDPPDNARRLWAMDTALRSSSVAAIVGDARGFDIACTRRLQLAAESGGAIALLARPLSEARALSSAATRRTVVPIAADEAGARPRWRIELLRSKGCTRADASGSWCVEWDHGAGTLVALPGVEHGSGLASDAARERLRA